MLLERNVELLLVGRDPNALRRAYPKAASCSYDQLAELGRGYDALVHMAVLNNTVHAPETEFVRVNVDLALEVLANARTASIPLFINISSIHALEGAGATLYALTKRQAAKELAAASGAQPAVTNVYLPAVIGKTLTGKLAILNRLPAPLRTVALSAAAALRPVVRVETLCRTLLDIVERGAPDRLIVSEGQASNLVFRGLKRALDLTFVVAVVVLLWWLLLLVWISVKLQSPGPGIFAQARVGRDGESFRCYKFRTMKIGTVEVATHKVTETAVTSVGAFLRRTKIDELPQIINIVFNQISLVGPRPCLLSQVELIEARRANGAIHLKPGITGLGQVNRVDMSHPARLAELDSQYGKLQSLLLDVKIILATARGRGRGDNIG